MPAGEAPATMRPGRRPSRHSDQTRSPWTGAGSRSQLSAPSRLTKTPS